jgi:hypothetical protein
MSFPHLARLIAQMSLAPGDEAQASGEARESVPWREVKCFMAMAEEALRVRGEAVTKLRL